MRNIIEYGIFVLALSLLSLNVLALPNPLQDSSKLANSSSNNDAIKLANNIDEPLTIGMCIDFIPYTHEELSKYSDMIVIGTVKEILPAKWNTVDGKQPNKSPSELSPIDDLIYTDIIINVDKYLKNPLSSNKVIVRVIYGTVGSITMTSDAEPRFEMGEKVLLYLSKDTKSSTKDIGSEHFIVTDFFKGKFTLTDDGKAIGTDENTTLEELLSTINQTDNKTNDTLMSDNTGTAGKQEGNLNSTPESKSTPFINSVWVLAVVLGAVTYVRKAK